MIAKTTLPFSRVNRHLNSQSGQVGIIIILIMVVMLTVGLSLATQSTKEVLLSTQEDESTRILNAAEAGVEEALATDLAAQSGTTITGTVTVPGSNADVNYTIKKLSSLETRVPEGGVVMVKLADPGTAPAVSGLTIDWAKDGDCAKKPATLIAEVFSFDSTKTPKTSVRHYAFPACDNGDSMAAPATMPVSTVSNGYTRQVVLSVGAKDTLVRIKPYYNDTYMRVNGAGGTLPTQSYLIQSTAVNTQSATNQTRSVEVNRTLSAAPAVMDYVLFSGTSIVQ